MNEKDLSRYYILKKEIDDLTERISEFGNGLSAVKFDKLNVQGSSQYKSIQEKYIELKDKWATKRVEALEEYMKIQDYIYSISDIEIRLILKYRFMDLKKWDDIDSILNNGYNYSKKKYYKWKKINLSQNIPQ